jgi:hypothetical protein
MLHHLASLGTSHADVFMGRDARDANWWMVFISAGVSMAVIPVKQIFSRYVEDP